MGNVNITLLNKKLLDEYGRGVTIYARDAGVDLTRIPILGVDSGIDLPKFRIVWSTKQTEVRYGVFEIQSESGVYLRTEEAVEETLKYPLWPDKYILEQLLPTDGNPYLERAGHKYSYEPKWVFGNGNSNPTPIWRAVKLLCDQIMHGKRIIKSPADILRDEEESIAREKILCKTILQNESPYLAGMLHNANGNKSGAVVVDGFRDKKRG